MFIFILSSKKSLFFPQSLFSFSLLLCIFLLLLPFLRPFEVLSVMLAVFRDDLQIFLALFWAQCINFFNYHLILFRSHKCHYVSWPIVWVWIVILVIQESFDTIFLVESGVEPQNDSVIWLAFLEVDEIWWDAVSTLLHDEVLKLVLWSKLLLVFGQHQFYEERRLLHIFIIPHHILGRLRHFQIPYLILDFPQLLLLLEPVGFPHDLQSRVWWINRCLIVQFFNSFFHWFRAIQLDKCKTVICVSKAILKLNSHIPDFIIFENERHIAASILLREILDINCALFNIRFQLVGELEWHPSLDVLAILAHFDHLRCFQGRDDLCLLWGILVCLGFGEDGLDSVELEQLADRNAVERAFWGILC